MTASPDWLVNYWLVEHPDIYGIMMFGFGLMVGMVIIAWVVMRANRHDGESE